MTKEPPILDDDDDKPLQLVSYGITHVGLERRNNEDAFFADEASGFFAVCDGMGGHASGEIASRIAVETMVRFVTETVHEPGFRFPFSTPEATTHETRILDSAVRLANRSVFAEAQKDATHKGMGTTLVAILCGEHTIGVVHVGDSRVYRWRDGSLDQITEDHSLLNHYRRTRPMTDDEIRTFKGKNVIVRAVGLRDSVQPEVDEIDALLGDILLLCSDGLSDLVDDETICAIINESEGDLSRATEELIDAALAAGGKDNVTVLLAQVVEGGRHAHLPTVAEREDTSPGFGIGPNGEVWDQETMPSYEIPALPDSDAQVIVAPELVDAPTPRELPALTPNEIARVVAQREARLRESGPVIAADLERPADPAVPPPIPGSGGRTLDVNAQTPPARLAASAAQAEQARRQHELGRVTAQTRRVPSKLVANNPDVWEEQTEPGRTRDSSGQPIPLPPGVGVPAPAKAIPLPPNVLAAEAAAAVVSADTPPAMPQATVIAGDDAADFPDETPSAGIPSLDPAQILALTGGTSDSAAPVRASADDDKDGNDDGGSGSDGGRGGSGGEGGGETSNDTRPPDGAPANAHQAVGAASWRAHDWADEDLASDELANDEGWLASTESDNAPTGSFDEDDDVTMPVAFDAVATMLPEPAALPALIAASVFDDDTAPENEVSPALRVRPALDPALEAVMRRSSVRRAAIPRGSRPVQDVETPFSRRDTGRPLPGSPAGDLAAGGVYDPSATVGPGVMPESGRPLMMTSRYERPDSPTRSRTPGSTPRVDVERVAATTEVDHDLPAADRKAPAVWDVPTLRMEAVTSQDQVAYATKGAAASDGKPPVPSLDTEPEVP